MKEKDGRPPRSLEAWRSLHAMDELERRFPEVIAFIEVLGTQNVDPKHVNATLNHALDGVKAGHNRTRENLPDKPTLAERWLHAASEVERLNQDREALAALAATVNAELAAVSALLATAETRLCEVALQREPIDQHVQAVVKKLVAAGLTAKTSRGIGAGQVSQIKAILNADEPASSPTPTKFHRQTAEVALAWKADNPWTTILRDVPGYRIKPRPDADIAVVRRCGLPPVSDLEDFGYPALFGAFEAATDPNAKDRACRRLCAKWVADHIASDFGPKVDDMRQRVWAFLFGVRYGYARDVNELARVAPPSPWKKDEQLLAERIG